MLAIAAAHALSPAAREEMKSARTRQNHRRSRLVATVVCIAGAAGASSAASGQPPTAPDATAYTTNGPVFAIARAGGRTYIGGDFTRVGVRGGPGMYGERVHRAI